ncbi:MAG: alpha/beta hydrolase family protein [Vicinamibacteria bacterium]
MLIPPRRRALAVLSFAALAAPALAQTRRAEPEASLEALQEQLRGVANRQAADQHRFDRLSKQVDDVMWLLQLSEVARIDKVRFTSKPVRSSNPKGQGAGNPLIVPAYTFVPKSLAADRRAPLVVLVHGGVHGDFATSNAHVVRELLEQGYVVIAPEYRGSTGYGRGFYDQIDYGGAEIDDTYAARNWGVENLPVDPARVAVVGWSHGGYHALLNAFAWPKAYQVVYAGVPVSDLVQRMGYKNQSYRDIFAGFIGKQAVDDPAEYKRRSPAFNAAKLETPLLVHTNTNDEDVNVMEVEHLIAALKAAGKKFEFKIYQDAPGGHAFNRIDTALARESRLEIWAFLARYLK